MKLRKKLQKNEIYFTILSSTALSVMAIIISYNSYVLTSKQTSIIEFQSKPDFIFSHQNLGTDSIKYDIKYDHKKLKNLNVKIHTIYLFNLDSISRTFDKNNEIKSSLHSKLGSKKYNCTTIYDINYNFDHNLVTIKNDPFMERMFQYFENEFNKKDQSKENEYKLEIQRKILFEIQYYTFLNQKITEFYKTTLQTPEREKYKLERWGEKNNLFLNIDPNIVDQLDFYTKIVAHLDFDNPKQEVLSFYKGSEYLSMLGSLGNVSRTEFDTKLQDMLIRLKN